MTRIIAVALQKGGVGKTTTAQHLAIGLVMRGRSVLLLDLDPQLSLTLRFDTHDANFTMADVLGVGGPQETTVASLKQAIIETHEQNLYLVPGSQDLRFSDDKLAGMGKGAYVLDMMLRDQRLPFDYVVIDTPPGKSSLLVSALVAADEIVIPVQLSPMGFEGFQGIDNTIQEARELQEVRGQIRLAYRAVVPTFYSRGEKVSDGYLKALESSEHPDYEDEQLPISLPIVQTTRFEQASAPRRIADSTRALSIWEMQPEDVVIRGRQAYDSLVQIVDTYA